MVLKFIKPKVQARRKNPFPQKPLLFFSMQLQLFHFYKMTSSHNTVLTAHLLESLATTGKLGLRRLIHQPDFQDQNMAQTDIAEPTPL